MTAAGMALDTAWPWIAGFGALLVLLIVAQIVLTLRQTEALRALTVRQESVGAQAPAAATRTAEVQEAMAVQQRRLEEALESLRQARDKATRADRASEAKSAFLTMMSHELRTPLSAIIGFAELIEQQAMGPVGNTKYRDYATDIRQSGQHLLGIINDILDLSKVESGRESLQEQDIGAQALFDRVRALLAVRAQEAGVALGFDVPDDLPVIRADKRRLVQILVNLLSNAVKFTPAGGSVTLRCWATPGSGVVFQSIDSGIGIAREDIPLALSVFGQVENDCAQQGTGLGLPLAKALAELHGGTLDLQSELGRGTTVTLRLPAYRIVAPALAMEAPAKDAPARDGPDQDAAHLRQTAAG